MPEPMIARILGVSRERVRRALHRLAHEGWLELVPNRGACIPETTEYNLIQIFEARIALEGAIVRLLAKRPSSLLFDEMTSHLQAERSAAEKNDRSRQIYLSGGFHEKLFSFVGNPWLRGFFNQVMIPTVSAYALFAPQKLPNCGGPQEHEAIFDAIQRCDGDEAERLMTAHLQEAIAHILRYRTSKVEVSIEEAFSAVRAVELQTNDISFTCSHCAPVLVD
jgi:DNA-binding GntR family transcriptional regulator